MQDEKLSINDVVSEIVCWLTETYPSDAAPSEIRQSLQALDNMSAMSFSDMLENYPDLSKRFENDEFEFILEDPEFEEKLDEAICNHVVFLEESLSIFNDDWDNF